MGKDSSELTPREEAFLDEYITNGMHATKAYLTISPQTPYKSATTLSARLLAKVGNGAIAARRRYALALTVTPEDVIGAMSEIMLSATAKDNDRVKAANLLAKIMGIVRTDREKEPEGPNVDAFVREFIERVARETGGRVQLTVTQAALTLAPAHPEFRKLLAAQNEPQERISSRPGEIIIDVEPEEEHAAEVHEPQEGGKTQPALPIELPVNAGSRRDTRKSGRNGRKKPHSGDRGVAARNARRRAARKGTPGSDGDPFGVGEGTE